MITNVEVLNTKKKKILFLILYWLFSALTSTSIYVLKSGDMPEITDLLTIHFVYAYLVFPIIFATLIPIDMISVILFYSFWPMVFLLLYQIIYRDNFYALIVLLVGFLCLSFYSTTVGMNLI